ncbi:MAG: ABC transporter permease, partial [Saprospiraceae bacterium]|nr:ABC transporter permease [Saprospiraceae bacterium]
MMLLSALMTSVAIVREKEMGTMEILLVSPMKPLLVVLTKAIPYLVLSFVNVIIILVLSVFVLEMPINGSLILLLLECLLFILTSLSLGLLISSATNSQQIAMFISLVGLMLPTIIFSGFLFPIENMPIPLQVISNIIPAKWFYIIVKSVMIKGLGIAVIWKETLILLGMTVFLMGISTARFKVRLE